MRKRGMPRYSRRAMGGGDRQRLTIRMPLPGALPNLAVDLFCSCGNVAFNARHCLRLSATGVGIGLIASLLVAGTISTLLYDTSPLDSPTFAAVSFALILFALAHQMHLRQVGRPNPLRSRHLERIRLRPTNGRADDQVRRNHSTQYSSYPDFDFARSRREAPEKYESYVDLQPGVWTKYKIEVENRKARLYVNGSEQPCLVVNDLKLDPRAGGVALWVGPGTEGYFSNLKITPELN